MRMWARWAGLLALLVASIWLVGCTAPEPSPASPTASPTASIAPESAGSLFLTIEKPESLESVVSTATITIVGKTLVNAVVSVNDLLADVDQDGRFTVPLQLEEGPNIIQVVASVGTGEEKAETITLIYSP